MYRQTEGYIKNNQWFFTEIAESEGEIEEAAPNHVN